MLTHMVLTRAVERHCGPAPRVFRRITPLSFAHSCKILRAYAAPLRVDVLKLNTSNPPLTSLTHITPAEHTDMNSCPLQPFLSRRLSPVPCLVRVKPMAIRVYLS